MPYVDLKIAPCSAATQRCVPDSLDARRPRVLRPVEFVCTIYFAPLTTPHRAPHSDAEVSTMAPSDRFSSHFVTPEQFNQIGERALHGPNGWMLFVACNAGIDFAEDVRKEYEQMLCENDSSIDTVPVIGSHDSPITAVFADTETCPRLDKYAAGSDAYVFQCCHQPEGGNTVNENIQQLIQVVRTLRAHRAKTITVVTPYSPYSRQDKPTFMRREAVLSRLFADQLKVAGADIHLCYHPHTYALHGFYEPDMVFVALSGLALLAEIFLDKMSNPEAVVVSTDAGGAKFTMHYADIMKVNYAIANKFRTGKDEADILGVIGDLEGKRIAIITDDETVTGTSLLNAVKQLHENHGIEEVHVAISHMKLRGEYVDRLVEAHENWGLKSLHITDSVPQGPRIKDLSFVTTHPIARRFAATINHMHYDESVSALFRDHEKMR